jgi:REP element-mobilizing transposase RayT
LQLLVPLHGCSAPRRKRLDHTAHFAGRFGAIYFVTICCQQRGLNQLCRDETAAKLTTTARIYHERQRWNLNLLLLMPDHLHALVGIDGQTRLAQLIRDYKESLRSHRRNMAAEFL